MTWAAAHVSMFSCVPECRAAVPCRQRRPPQLPGPPELSLHGNGLPSACVGRGFPGSGRGAAAAVVGRHGCCALHAQNRQPAVSTRC